MGGRRLLCAALVGLAGVLALAPSARATFHEISIREVYPGSLAQPDSDYVVLQMYFGGQQFVKNHALTTYGSGGGVTGTFAFPANLLNGANQQTILVGDSEVGTVFGVTPDLASTSFALDPTGGAVCWAGSLDCVSWGAFSGSTPSSSGSPADPLGIPNGMALRRTIAPSCPTLLEFGDDSNDSDDDFADAAPQPRNNASAITEAICTGPDTTIDTKPTDPTKATSASFTYHASQAGASFECRLDAAVFADCPEAGISYPGPLADGLHTFRVRSESEAGFLGPTATYTWQVDTIAPTVIIDDEPADPSPGASASFTFHASEAGSSFQCSLAAGAAADSFSDCTSGKTYTDLAEGGYTFKVRATDKATNQGPATVYEWTVDNTAPDTTPPDTLIDSTPADPSESPSASFTYHATEAGSSFECKLDGASFAACPATGIDYEGLANGEHTFQVRATDPSENTDLSPAGFTFSVAVPAPETPGPTGPAVTPPAVTPTTTPIVITSPPKKRPRPKRCRRRKHAHSTHGHALHRQGKRCKRKQRNRATASTFHLVMVREVYPGSSGNLNAEYVELQMYAGGQEFVKGHRVDFFDSVGGSLGSVTFGSDVARGSSQSTLLIATPEAESQFGIAADEGTTGDRIKPDGGAVCWEALDCVSWGSFDGSLPSLAGSPADPGGIPDGQALRRTIAPGCPTQLEASDDHDNSALDFTDAFPAPRPNAVVPSERACASSGGGGAGGGQGGPGGGNSGRPQTKLGRKPAKHGHDRTPTFGFSSTRAGSTFFCKLDGRPFRRCRSPYTAPRLSLGDHVFRVKARTPGGLLDKSPAIWRFEISQHG